MQLIERERRNAVRKDLMSSNFCAKMSEAGDMTAHGQVSCEKALLLTRRGSRDK